MAQKRPGDDPPLQSTDPSSPRPLNGRPMMPQADLHQPDPSRHRRRAAHRHKFLDRLGRGAVDRAGAEQYALVGPEHIVAQMAATQGEDEPRRRTGRHRRPLAPPGRRLRRHGGGEGGQREAACRGERSCYTLQAFICLKMELRWRSKRIGNAPNNVPFKKEPPESNFRQDS